MLHKDDSNALVVPMPAVLPCVRAVTETSRTAVSRVRAAPDPPTPARPRCITCMRRRSQFPEGPTAMATLTDTAIEEDSGQWDLLWPHHKLTFKPVITQINEIFLKKQSPLLLPSPRHPCLALALFGSCSKKKSHMIFLNHLFGIILSRKAASCPHFISCRLLWVINTTRHQSGRNLVFFPSNQSRAIWRSSSNETAFETCSDKAIFKKKSGK